MSDDNVWRDTTTSAGGLGGLGGPSFTTLIPKTRPDAEVAKELRERLEAALIPVIGVMNDATQAGLVVEFQLGRDSLGRSRIQVISIARPL